MYKIHVMFYEIFISPLKNVEKNVICVYLCLSQCLFIYLFSKYLLSIYMMILNILTFKFHGDYIIILVGYSR